MKKIVTVCINEQGQVSWEAKGDEGLSLDDIGAIIDSFNRIVNDFEDRKQELKAPHFKKHDQWRKR